MSDVAQKGTKIVMMNAKVCIFAGKMGAKEFAQLERYAKEGCTIAFMDKDKKLGEKLKKEFKNEYQVTVFFSMGTRKVKKIWICFGEQYMNYTEE